MAQNQRGGFVPPSYVNLLWECPECGEFNPAAEESCEQCGAAKVISEALAGSAVRDLELDERKDKWGNQQG